MKSILHRSAGRIAVVSSLLVAGAAHAQAESKSHTSAEEEDNLIIVTGTLTREAISGTKTSTPLIETPQHLSIITDDVYLAQGALSIEDTLRYTSGVQTSAYGLDSRVDSFFIRGVTPVQYRDGMRELFGFYNSITADPYNFSRIEVVRGPASVLFGQGSIGGLVNLVSKVPQFDPAGEVSLRYGSFDRKEGLFDLTGPLNAGQTVAARLVGRVRDSGTQTDFVEDDRVLLSPSIRFQPTPDTDIVLIGLYQEDDTDSTAQFPPLVGSLLPNPSGRIPISRYFGEPGFDRYDGRILQGTAILQQRLTNWAQLRTRARYTDSHVAYEGHYPDSYSNPMNPYLDPDQRVLNRFVYINRPKLEVLTSDTNLQFDFATGAAIEHTLLVGIDYLWNRLEVEGGFGLSTPIDAYDPVYGSMILPPITERPPQKQSQLGVYAQDQIRLFDRVSVVLGARHDEARNEAAGRPRDEADATTFRAGIIGEVGSGFAPFFSYTESFLPIAGQNVFGEPFRPQRGEQYELGVKWQPDRYTLVTATGYDISDTNRLTPDPANPRNSVQTGEVRSRGLEFEAIRIVPGDYDVFVNYSYNNIEVTKSNIPSQIGFQLANVPKHNASAWGAKTFPLGPEMSLRIGAGVRYVGENVSRSAVWTIVTPDVTLVDALISLDYREWNFRVNANNLLGESYYAACLARGDCFVGAERNVFGTVSYRF